jgi:hypothetical protein
MKLMTKLGLAAVLAAGMAFDAQAILVVDPTQPAPVTFFQKNGNVTADYIQTLTGDTVTEVYKQNVGGAEESDDFASSYTTTFTPPSNPTGATIVYNGGAFITGDPIYLLAKDGSTGHYLWDITGWDGKETIEISGLYPGGNGSISHVSIFTGGGTSVPDAGTTLALLGMALGLVGFAGRKIGA